MNGDAIQLFVSDVCLGTLAEVSGTLGTSVCTIQPAQIQKSEVNVYKRDVVRNRKVWSLQIYQYL